MSGNSVKHLVLGGAGVLVVLVVAGVPLATALPYAVLLACPLMMVVMMAVMARGHGTHSDRDSAKDDEPVQRR